MHTSPLTRIASHREAHLSRPPEKRTLVTKEAGEAVADQRALTTTRKDLNSPSHSPVSTYANSLSDATMELASPNTPPYWVPITVPALWRAVGGESLRCQHWTTRFLCCLQLVFPTCTMEAEIVIPDLGPCVMLMELARAREP